MDLKEDKQADKDLCDANQKEIETILTCLIYCSTSRTITGEARDAIIELIMRNCEYRALNWAERLVDINGTNNSVLCIFHVNTLTIVNL